jgi:hypothetical protein
VCLLACFSGISLFGKSEREPSNATPTRPTPLSPGTIWSGNRRVIRPYRYVFPEAGFGPARQKYRDIDEPAWRFLHQLFKAWGGARTQKRLCPGGYATGIPVYCCHRAHHTPRPSGMGTPFSHSPRIPRYCAARRGYAGNAQTAKGLRAIGGNGPIIRSARTRRHSGPQRWLRTACRRTRKSSARP